MLNNSYFQHNGEIFLGTFTKLNALYKIGYTSIDSWNEDR